MPYICRDCKLYYGHPLRWCPGCGKELKQQKYNEAEDSKLLRQRNEGWRFEGDKNLFEYYLNGKLVEGEPGVELIAAAREKYPKIFEELKMPVIEDKIGEGGFMTFHKMGGNWESDQHNRKWTIKFYIRDQLDIYIRNPYIRYRLKGSDLKID